MLRVSSPLSEELEALVTDTIGCCIKVHRALGPGLLETVYSRAVAIELRTKGISFDRERRYQVSYRGELLCEQHLDFVIADVIVLEIKSIEAIAPIHHAQLLSYLRVSKLRVGLLVNFNVAVLKDGLVRRVL
jgi:GxxExxY protein